MSTKSEKINSFDPNGVGVKNGRFIGLPFEESEAKVVLLPVPWDVTVSFQEGTSTGPQNILESSYQLDLFDDLVADAWKIGLYMRQPDQSILEKNEINRRLALTYIELLESGHGIEGNDLGLGLVNAACRELKAWVKTETAAILDQGQLVGIIGGDHSSPLGLLEALGERHDDFGILQLDAHMDLRKAYEGFTFSHASIFYNALAIPQIKKLVQVGIRDCCEEEIQFAESEGERVEVYFDQAIKAALFEGQSFHKIAKDIVDSLPRKVYVSFDIDALNPSLCPHTGTPVPGGLNFNEAIYLLDLLVKSDRQIIGFDLCEVAGIGHDWDGNVGARLAYKLSNLMAKSNRP